MMMIRGRIPGGVMTPAQWITFDDLASTYGNNTLRITTRRHSFHGVVKLTGIVVKKITSRCSRPLAACGDVTATYGAPTPVQRQHAQDVAGRASRGGSTCAENEAYHSIWIDGVQLNIDDATNKDFVDPLYGKTYLPRSSKSRSFCRR